MAPDVSRFRNANRLAWDERAPAHAASPGYRLDRFRSDPAYLSEVVHFDLPRLGSVDGLRGLHLQCHIGTDTLSLERLGATMTGLDFSAASLDMARSLAEDVGSNAVFVQSDVYDAPAVLGTLDVGPFDFVFTGIGALCWLPDIRAWAGVVHDLLEPGGRLFVREGHPMLWALDERRTDGTLAVTYPYFEVPDPVLDESEESYVETDRTFTHTVSYTWNHGLGEIVTALLDVGMEITMLVEHDSVPWEALPGHMAIGDDGEWRLVEGRERLPLTYTLQARRTGQASRTGQTPSRRQGG